MSSIVELSVLNGPKKGTQYTFENQDTFVLGRANDCTCVIYDDKTFSRHHMLIEINNQNAVIIDLGSLNGTYVNDTLVGKREKHMDASDGISSKPVVLKDNDIIRAGNYQFIIHITQPNDDAGETVLIGDSHSVSETIFRNDSDIPGFKYP